MCRFCEKLAYGDEEHKMIEPLLENKDIILSVDPSTPIQRRQNDATMSLYSSSLSETLQIGISYCPKCGRPLRKVKTHPISRDAFTEAKGWSVDMYPGRDVYTLLCHENFFARVVAYKSGRTDLIVHVGDKTTAEGFQAQVRVETLEDVKAVLGVYGLTCRFEYENF